MKRLPRGWANRHGMVGHNPKLKMSQPLPLKAEAGASIRYFAFGPKAEVISRFIGLAKLSLAITLPGFGSSRRLDPEIIAEAKPTMRAERRI